MTKKDFELIAAVLKGARIRTDAIDTLPGLNVAAVRLADALATTNPRFEREKFLNACGVAS